MSHYKIWQLVARKLSGEASLEELKELDYLLQDDPEMAYKTDIFCHYFAHPSKEAFRSKEAKEQSLELFRTRFSQEFNQESQPVSQPRSFIRSHALKLTKWAAVAAALAAIIITVFYLNRGEIKHTEIAQYQVNEINTMPGTRSKTILPDGTTVWLNSESHISYNADFGNTKREITLIGEAFFDVAHNEAIPMIVHAKTVSILVKGTAFNVRCYPESNNIQTSLIRGSVELTTPDHPDRKILLKPNEKITISVPAETGNKENNETKKMEPAKINHQSGKFYHIDSLKQSALADVIPEISWVENQLVFDNDLFVDVIDKMKKWYNVDIELLNHSLGEKRFSGAFVAEENISEALSALQFINDFDFEITGRKVIIK